jgi:hypothetical protein
MINTLKSTISKNITNIVGWKTNRKIIVIESDDWGSIRMPNKDVYTKLERLSFSKEFTLYDRLDSLERLEDLQSLLDIAKEFKDFNDKPLVFTLNTVMQNPDFEKIKAGDYKKFYGIPFFESYKQFYGQDLRDLWSKGIEEQLIKPQFHAREHLNVHLWLNDLRNYNKNTREAFDNGYFGLRTETSSKLRNHYLATYFAENEEEFSKVVVATKQGLEMFKNVFGYHSKTFIASNYYWPKELEKILANEGVKGLQALRGGNFTNYKRGTISTKRLFTGQKNKFGQIYTVRNVIFEPYSDKNKDWVASGLKDVQNAFLWKKPAIICMHRVNFASEMNLSNRDHNLQLLKKFITEILKKYPDVEFMSSDALIKEIAGGHS